MAEKRTSNNRNKTLKLSMVMASVVLLSLLFTFLAVITAAGQEVVVSVNAPEEVEAGESFDVTIDIEDVTDFNSGQFDLSFDSSVVEVTDVTAGSIDGETIPKLLPKDVDADTDTVKVIARMPGGVGVSGSGHLAEVGFKVTGKEGDKCVLDISNGSLYDNREMVFDVDKEFVEEFKDELNDEEISEDLKEFFKANGCPLENPIVNIIQKDEQWEINDKRVYRVKFKKGKIDVLDRLEILDLREILKTKWVDAEIFVGEEEEEEEEEEVGEEVTPGYSNITTWSPVETVVNNSVGESRTFTISVNKIADISWQINGTEMQTNESVSEAVYTNTKAVIGTWNVSAIATNTTTGLSDMQTWIWHVTLTAIVTPTPTLAPGETLKPTLAPGVTPKSTPTLAPEVTPLPATTPTPTPKPPGFEAILAVAMMLTIAYILRRKS